MQGAGLTQAAVEQIAANLSGQPSFATGQAQIDTAQPVTREMVAALRARFPFDINAVPDSFDASAVRLLITDMDSTLINIECVDEIADFIGIKPQVAAITAAAMRGEINFETSLRQRISLLRGLDATVLDRVYRERLKLNNGAEQLVARVRARGIKVALVSGGFTFFTERLRERLRLDYTLANEIEVNDGRLSGHVRGAIVGATAKAGFLLTLCDELGIDPARAIAIGDGANDLPMLNLAGLSVAYHAKPAVQVEAKVVLNHAGLDAVLAFLEN